MVNLETRIKKRRKILFGLVILLMVLFTIDFGLTQNQIPPPISYDFYDNTFINRDSTYIPSMYNIDGNIESYTGNYPSAYLYDEYTQTSLENDFTIDTPVDTSITMVDEYKEHTDVVEIYDGNNSAEASISYDLSDKPEIFSLSFWQLSIIDGNYPRLHLAVFDKSANRVSLLRFHSDYDDEVDYKDSTGIVTAYEDYFNDTWTNYYLQFDYTNDIINLYINYIFIATYDFEQRIDDLDYLRFYTKIEADDLTCYLDAIDFSFNSGYYYQRNFLPTTIKQQEYQMDNFEFDYSEQNFLLNGTRFKVYDDTLEQIGLNQPSDIHSEIYMAQNPDASSTYYTSVTWNTELESDLFTYSCSFEVEQSNDLGASTTWFFDFNGNADEEDFVISILTYSDDHIQPVVYSKRIGDYYYFPELEFNETYTWDVTVNFQDNYFDVSITGIDYSYSFSDMFHENTFEYSTILEYIKIQQNNHISYDFDMILYLKNMNIKNANGYNSFNDYTTNEYGMLTYYLGNLDLREHNLFTIDFPYDHEVLYYPNLAIYNGIKISQYPSVRYEKTYNLYAHTSYSNTYLGIKTYGNFTLPEKVKVHGVALSYANKLAIPDYYYESSELSNHFYVQGKKLYYNFTRGNADKNESMSMRFFVDDYQFYNKSFRYTSYVENNYNASITLMNSNLNYQTFNATELLSTQTIDIDSLNNTNLNSIYITVECFDDNAAQSDTYSDGYISDLDIITPSSLYDFDDIDDLGLGFTDGLLQVAIKLLLFLIPIFIVLFIFGYKSLVPMWLLMLIIYFITSIIPFWMVAIQGLALLMMFIIPKKERDEINGID